MSLGILRERGLELPKKSEQGLIGLEEKPVRPISVVINKPKISHKKDEPVQVFDVAEVS
jgi:hypothetical protein